MKLIGIKYITNMSYMFYDCESLLALPDISKIDISRVTDISFMFGGCSSLAILPDISKWDTCNVRNMMGVFLIL